MVLLLVKQHRKETITSHLSRLKHFVS